tara:strand:+ start:29581 stop:29745 length:165 start_codon:yes stop_codon:yes gene_type:complete
MNNSEVDERQAHKPTIPGGVLAALESAPARSTLARNTQHAGTLKRLPPASPGFD